MDKNGSVYFDEWKTSEYKTIAPNTITLDELKRLYERELLLIYKIIDDSINRELFGYFMKNVFENEMNIFEIACKYNNHDLINYFINEKQRIKHLQNSEKKIMKIETPIFYGNDPYFNINDDTIVRIIPNIFKNLY